MQCIRAFPYSYGISKELNCNLYFDSIHNGLQRLLSVHTTYKCKMYHYNMHSHPSTTTNYGRKLVTRRKNEKAHTHTHTHNQLHDALNWKTFDRDDNCYIYFCCCCVAYNSVVDDVWI